MKAQMGDTVTGRPIDNIGTSRDGAVNASPLSLYPRERAPVPILHEAE
jgi:hypothetical protein